MPVGCQRCSARPGSHRPARRGMARDDLCGVVLRRRGVVALSGVCRFSPNHRGTRKRGERDRVDGAEGLYD